MRARPGPSCPLAGEEPRLAVLGVYQEPFEAAETAEDQARDLVGALALMLWVVLVSLGMTIVLSHRRQALQRRGNEVRIAARSVHPRRDVVMYRFSTVYQR